MCGFIGRINKSDSAPAITGALQFLGRRGPDSHSEWISTDGCIELMHARLAIVDTDPNSHQPFTDSRNGVTVAFNGEIYNYRELRSEISDYQFRTESDTEVIIALYVTRGIAGLKELRGTFGLTIVDTNRRRVYLVRDPIGKKPLFLAKWPGGTYFGSSVLSLIAASNESCRVDEISLKHFWTDGHAGPHESLIKDCAPVAPGQVIELDWTGDILRIDSCTPELSGPLSMELGAIREYTGALISKSVKRRLSNNPNPVCLLSGGVDSTVIAGCMKKLVGGSAITLGSVVPGMNDEKYARFAAKKLELPIQVVRARAMNLAEDVAWSLNLQDEPLGMISFFPLSLMIRAAKDYGKILLTGDGGDEVFLGYGEPQDWVTTEKTTVNDPPAALPVPQWMSQWGKNMLTTSLLGHMFTKLDRASAEQGVETRCPLLDVDLVSFVRTLDPESLFFNERPKALLRDQLANWPRSFVNRRKMGFTYNLRWAWATNRFAGLREMIDRDAIITFESQLPPQLRAGPNAWTTLNIFRNFPAVWKLLAWSSFNERLSIAINTARKMKPKFKLELAATVDSRLGN